MMLGSRRATVTHHLKILIKLAVSAVLLCTATVIMPANAAVLQSISLAWDPSPDSGVVGYNVYYGPASGAYTNTIPAGSATSAVISNLVEGATYYFVATAYDISG